MRVSREISLGSSLHRASTDALIHHTFTCGSSIADSVRLSMMLLITVMVGDSKADALLDTCNTVAASSIPFFN